MTVYELKALPCFVNRRPDNSFCTIHQKNDILTNVDGVLIQVFRLIKNPKSLIDLVIAMETLRNLN